MSCATHEASCAWCTLPLQNKRYSLPYVMDGADRLATVLAEVEALKTWRVVAINLNRTRWARFQLNHRFPCHSPCMATLNFFTHSCV